MCLITRGKFCKKVLQNEMIMFLHKCMSLRDFDNFLCQKTLFFIIFMFCFPIDTSMERFIIGFC